MRSRNLRLLTALALAPVMLVSVAFMGSTAFGKPKPSAAQYQYKTVLCHRTKSQTNPGVTIRVSAKAVPAHMRHGDALGPCASASETSTTSAATTAQGNGQGKGQGQGSGKGNAKGKNK